MPTLWQLQFMKDYGKEKEEIEKSSGIDFLCLIRKAQSIFSPEKQDKIKKNLKKTKKNSFLNLIFFLCEIISNGQEVCFKHKDKKIS